MSRAVLMNSLLSDAEMTRARLVKFGSDYEHVAYPAAATDMPVAVTEDGNSAAEYPVALNWLGLTDAPVLLKMEGAGSAGDLICPNLGGAGKGRAVPDATTSVYVCAIALVDWTDEEEIPVLSFAARQYQAATVTQALTVLGAFTPPAAGVAFPLPYVTQAFVLGDFTDGTGADGTLSVTDALPQGFIPLAYEVEMSSVAGGDGHTLAIGIGSDADAIAAAASITSSTRIAGLVAANTNADPDAALAAAQDLLLTASETDDFGDYTALEGTVRVYGVNINAA